MEVKIKETLIYILCKKSSQSSLQRFFFVLQRDKSCCNEFFVLQRKLQQILQQNVATKKNTEIFY